MFLDSMASGDQGALLGDNANHWLRSGALGDNASLSLPIQEIKESASNGLIVVSDESKHELASVANKLSTSGY